MVSELAAETVKIGNTFVRSSWTDTETDKNRKKETLNIVICVSDTIVKGKLFGENCARLKAVIRKSTVNYDVIFETKNLKFRFRTPDGNSNNYKLWLGNDSGTQNDTRIREVLAQLDRSQGMALGAMCKKLSDSSWLAEKLESVKENTRNYRIDRKILNKIKLGSAVTNWSNIGLSCYSSVRKKIANIELASISREEANKICSFDLQFASEDKNIDLNAIQKGLKSRSLYEGAVDGVLGKGSCAAFNKFMACERTSPASFSREDYLSLLSKNISEEKQSCYDGKITTTIAAKAVSKNGLESQLESLQNTIDGLRSENKNLKQTLVEKKKAESSGQENLRRELEDLKSEYESLKSNISNENKEQTFEAKQTIDELKAQIVELKEEAKKPKKDEQNLVYMATAIANLQKEIAEKEMRGSKQDEKIKKLDAEIEKIEKEKAALKVAIQSLESLLVAKDEVLADKDELYSELERRFQSSKNDIKDIENQYTNRLAAKSEEIDRLNNILRSVQQLVSNTFQNDKIADLTKNSKQEESLFPIDVIFEKKWDCSGKMHVEFDKQNGMLMVYDGKTFINQVRHVSIERKSPKKISIKQTLMADKFMRDRNGGKDFTTSKSLFAITLENSNLISVNAELEDIDIDTFNANPKNKKYIKQTANYTREACNSNSPSIEAEKSTSSTGERSNPLTEVIFEKKWGCLNNTHTVYDKNDGSVFVMNGEKQLGDGSRKVTFSRKSPTKIEIQTTMTSGKFMTNLNGGTPFTTRKIVEEITVESRNKFSAKAVHDHIDLDAFMANPKNKKYKKMTENYIKVACD